MKKRKRERQFGRKDHYAPQGYLRGFIDPTRSGLDKPLWHFDIESKQWSEKSTREVGWERGFYDYDKATPDMEHPDVTFAKFEREFPLVRDTMLRKGFKDWAKQQKTFLLGYMQMMRARSPLFIEQSTKQNEGLRMVKVTSVGPRNKVTVDTMEPYAPTVQFVRNRTISMIREEIQKGVDWAADFHWCLRYTRSPNNPFVTGTLPVVTEGPAPTLVEAMSHPDTLIWFPLCWQACLIGSLRRFDKGTDEADQSVLNHVREMFLRPSSGYVISPSKFVN